VRTNYKLPVANLELMVRNRDSEIAEELVEILVNPGAKKTDVAKSVTRRDRDTQLKEWSKELHADLDKTYFISDLHLDHVNIIRYSSRPFDSIDEMNSFIIRSWNRTVMKRDPVFFLGDMAYGRGSRTIDYWASKLKGEIFFIKGSHDRSKTIKLYDKIVLRVNGQRFLLVHDPFRKPHGWNGWVIHGHLHNRDPTYSLVNKETRTVNVSAEIVDYKPISLERILELCC
jgi:calcineurin-like phosphoesterase family protein